MTGHIARTSYTVFSWDENGQSKEYAVKIYNNILVATDFSAAADAAVAQAHRLASLMEARLTVLHVLEHFPEDIPNYSIAPENTDPEKYYTDEARKKLQQISDNLESDQLWTEILVSTNSAGREITGYASDKGMDLIIVGSHGKRGILGMAGSTASSVLHAATVDVLVVKN
jgi:universal stress protein A